MVVVVGVHSAMCVNGGEVKWHVGLPGRSYIVCCIHCGQVVVVVVVVVTVVIWVTLLVGWWGEIQISVVGRKGARHVQCGV